ncbi:MAG: hypothetical protein HYX27_22040 [Acidobacteria bacterium]|nr:hypothetical protein [Acidobacteriota bacterium]
MYAVQVCPPRATAPLIPLVVFASIAIAQNPPTDRIRDLNNEVLQLHGAIQTATASHPGFGRSPGEQAIERRAAVLSQLIDQDPGTALKFAFSEDLLADLAAKFPAAAARLESRGDWQGTIESFVFDYSDGTHRTQHKLRTANGTLELHFAGSEPAAAQCGKTVSVTGARLDNQVAVATSELVALSASTNIAPSATSDASATGCPVTGVQKTVVILATFPGVTPPSNVTPQSIADGFFGSTGRSLDSYWKEASYGKTSASGDIFGWYTLPTSFSCTTTDDLRAAAITMAAGAGVNFQNYSRLFIVVPDMGCGWAGAATLGCATLSSPSGAFTATTSYLNSSALSSRDKIVSTAAHEGGHNLGLAHANSRAFGTEALGSVGAPGNLIGYGDGFSVMSNGGLGHYAASHKANQLNWLSTANYQVVQSSGTFTLQPFEAATNGLQALKIQRGTGGGAWVWVEYRQPIGNYDNSYFLAPDVAQWYSWANQVFSGALIHYEDPNTGTESHLLDFTPTSDSAFYDPALAAGKSWVDPYSNLSISVQSATASGLTLSVSYGGGASACVRANPTVTLPSASPTVYPGASASYTVAVVNKDSAACPSSTFALASTQPGGWLAQYSTTSLTISPGGTGSATLTESVPAGTAPATYGISASAANGAYAASGLANATVVLPPALSAVTSVPAASYAARETVVVTCVVAAGSAAAAGAAVTFQLTKADGTKVTGNATADLTGKATWSYKIANRDPKGTSSVKSTAVYNSQSTTSDSVAFVIQ